MPGTRDVALISSFDEGAGTVLNSLRWQVDRVGPSGTRTRKDGCGCMRGRGGRRGADPHGCTDGRLNAISASPLIIEIENASSASVAADLPRPAPCDCHPFITTRRCGSQAQADGRRSRGDGHPVPRCPQPQPTEDGQVYRGSPGSRARGERCLRP